MKPPVRRPTDSIATAADGTITGTGFSRTSGFVPAAPTLSSIAVTPANPSIVAGTTQQFTATGTYSDSSTADLTGSVTWASDTSAAATINAGGLATGVAAGTSTISATLGPVSGSTMLTVTPVTHTISGTVTAGAAVDRRHRLCLRRGQLGLRRQHHDRRPEAPTASALPPGTTSCGSRPTTAGYPDQAYGPDGDLRQRHGHRPHGRQPDGRRRPGRARRPPTPSAAR